MNKRAFTIIELAIVLIIIGIIMGMAIRGNYVVNSANMRNELRKVDKIRTALTTWRANNPVGISVYPHDGTINTSLIIDALVNLNYLQEADIVSSLGRWTLIRGDMLKNGIPTTNDVGRSFILRKDSFTANMLCNFEVLSDDKDFLTGNVRGQGVTAQHDPQDPNPNAWNECAKWSKAINTNNVIYIDAN